jgi:hypothetical protein
MHLCPRGQNWMLIEGQTWKPIDNVERCEKVHKDDLSDGINPSDDHSAARA